MQKRLAFIDAIKGVGILKVVYHHLVLNGMRDTGYESTLDIVMSMFYMSLFFFLSGYFDYKKGKELTVSSIFSTIIRRGRQLLIPTVVFFTFCMLYFHLSFREYTFDTWKCGYWFTLTLFEVFILHLAVCKLTEKIDRYQAVIQILLGIILFYLGTQMDVNNKIIGLFSVNMVCKYYIGFVLGYCVHKYQDTFSRWLSNQYISAVLLLCSAIPFIITVQSEWKVFFIICQILIVFQLFASHEDYFSSSKLIPRFLGTMGRHTFEIYLLHFLFLFKIDFVYDFLSSLQGDLCFRGESCRLVPELFLITGIAICIAYTCIIVRYIIGVSPLLSELCFGQIRKKSITPSNSQK